VSDALALIAAYAPPGTATGPGGREATGEAAGGATGEATREATAARRYLVLDVFTDIPLAGNALAVVTDGRGLAAPQMQRIARELNLSETVFVLAARAGGDARIRIFTPHVELPFAGHPVLGSAILIGSALGRSQVVLETGSGEVPVELRPAAQGAPFGRMQQPLPSFGPYGRADELLAAIGVEASTLPVEQYVNGPRHVYVGLDSEQELAALRPDLQALAELGAMGVGCFAGAGARWKSRNFAPGLGVPEDPATGSAAGPLAVHLARNGSIAFGEEIAIRQGEEIGRPSLLYASAHGTPQRIERVEVGGHAVFVATGELLPECSRG
jgi:trans-2,3-dihydro-3-hydroxyanthranilate isomerase